LNARNFFARQKDDLRRHQFGGVIGGPIKKVKLFLCGITAFEISFVELNPTNPPTIFWYL
jgi:hypothetical protein